MPKKQSGIVRRNAHLPATIDKLHEFILIGTQTLKVHKAKIRAITKLDIGQAAEEAALHDGQAAGEILLDAQSKLGTLLEPLANPTASRAGRRQLPAGITHKESHYCQQLAKHPEAVEKAKSRAVVLKTIPTAKQALQFIKQDREGEPSPDLPKGKYSVLYADPPWKYGADMPDYYGGAKKHYAAMTIEQLCELDIKKVAAKDAVLFLWVTAPKLNECWPVILAWGFQYKTQIVWDKIKHNYGHYVSVRHENLLICGRGKSAPHTGTLEDSVISTARTSVHSEKPDAFRHLIERMYPHGKYLELFARKSTPNWTIWGEQT